jgi:hypothetical protein
LFNFWKSSSLFLQIKDLQFEHSPVCRLLSHAILHQLTLDAKKAKVMALADRKSICAYKVSAGFNILIHNGTTIAKRQYGFYMTSIQCSYVPNA